MEYYKTSIKHGGIAAMSKLRSVCVCVGVGVGGGGNKSRKCEEKRPERCCCDAPTFHVFHTRIEKIRVGMLMVEVLIDIIF